MAKSKDMTAREASDRLRSHAEPGRAEKLVWFFKARPGGYGEGDRFHGVRVPIVRQVAREFARLPLAETVKLLRSEFHEERLLGLFLLVRRYESGDEAGKQTVYETYLEHLRHVNNWDLVDASAHRIVGRHLLSRDRDLIYRLARSAVLWERRIAVISTFAFIAGDDFDDALAIAELLLEDEEDLIHKAVGWMLRELGKRDLDRLLGFLDRHWEDMPRTMVRYAIERLPAEHRERYRMTPEARARARKRARDRRPSS